MLCELSIEINKQSNKRNKIRQTKLANEVHKRREQQRKFQSSKSLVIVKDKSYRYSQYRLKFKVDIVLHHLALDVFALLRSILA